MMRLEWEFAPGPGRIAAYLRMRMCMCMCMRGARMQKKTRGFDRAFFCLEAD